MKKTSIFFLISFILILTVTGCASSGYLKSDEIDSSYVKVGHVSTEDFFMNWGYIFGRSDEEKQVLLKNELEKQAKAKYGNNCVLSNFSYSSEWSLASIFVYYMGYVEDVSLEADVYLPQNDANIVVSQGNNTQNSNNSRSISRQVQEDYIQQNELLSNSSISSLNGKIAVSKITASNEYYYNTELVINVLSSSIENRLCQYKNLIVIDRTQTEVLEQENDFQLSGMTSESEINAGIGKLLGANYLVTAKVDSDGNKLYISLRILEASSSRVVYSKSCIADSIEDINRKISSIL